MKIYISNKTKQFKTETGRAYYNVNIRFLSHNKKPASTQQGEVECEYLDTCILEHTQSRSRVE